MKIRSKYRAGETIPVTVRFSQEVVTQLEERAKATGATASGLARHYVVEALKSYSEREFEQLRGQVEALNKVIERLITTN